MPFVATGEFVVVRPCRQEASPGGILLPDNLEVEGPVRALVDSVGEKVELDIDAGDVVLYANYNSFDVGGGLVAIRAGDIVAVEEARTSEREAIYDEIDEERIYQDRKWGGPAADDQKSEASWLNHIAEYSRGPGRAAGHDFRTRMVKTAALAVAAIESHDRQEQLAAQCGRCGCQVALEQCNG